MAPMSGIATEDGMCASSLREAASGLLYTSEGDHAFDVVSVPGGAGTWPLDAAQFASLMQLPAGTHVTTQSIEQFFARHIERADPADATLQAMRPRYEKLRDIVKTELRDARVFRAGEVEVRCYVVGSDANGNLCGLATTSTET